MEAEQSKISDIKTMKLYSHVDRVYNELRELGYDLDDRSKPLKVEDVSKVDQYHYHGTAAIDHAINNLGIVSTSNVLDIGSGLGGPARYLAYKAKCHVTALELQADLNSTAQDLTNRCQLGQLIKHLCGNFMDMDLGDLQQQDLIVSWLVFLHISDKELLLQRCHECLKPGGKMYVEDFFLKTPMTPQESFKLEKEVFCHELPSKDQYIQCLEKAGFTHIQFEDVSSSWADFVHKRYQAYQASRERHIRVHNETVFKEQEHFFASIDNFFTGGHVGGCRITASRAQP